MSFMLKYLEFCIGRLLYYRRGYDAQCLFNTKPFRTHNTPTIPITSPDCGNSVAKLSDDHSMFGAGKIPTLTWPSADASVKEYVFMSEDPDAPLGHPNVHGLYFSIPPTAKSISPSDLEIVKEEDGVKIIKSGWRVGKNRRNRVYIPARPPRGHGPHRYYFVLVALKEKLAPETMSKVPTKEEVVDAIDGKVASWGVWEATYESKL